MSQRIAVAWLLVILAATASVLPLAAAEANAAGVVVQYGDGSRTYAYVQFAEKSISSEELLARTGLAVVMAPFGGMGAAVCSIDGEGCPSSSCWCQSYSSPSYFWHFYAWQDERWIEQLSGASARQVENGDVDGWLWTAGDTTLPAITIDDIAAAAGVDRGNGATDASGPPLDPSITAIFVSAGETSPSPSASSARPYVLFGGMLLVVLAAAAVVVVRNRMRSADVEGPAHE